MCGSMNHASLKCDWIVLTSQRSLNLRSFYCCISLPRWLQQLQLPYDGELLADTDVLRS